VKVRSSIAAVLVLSLLAQAPSSAHAQEIRTAPVEWVVRAPTPIDLRMSSALHTTSLSNAPLVPWFGAKPAPVKLSNGAITAIIIGGIVLVVLVVAGVAVLGKPGKIK